MRFRRFDSKTLLTRILIIVPIVIIAGVIIGSLITLTLSKIDRYRFEFIRDDLQSTRYYELFKPNYQTKIEPVLSTKSRIGDYYIHYKYASHDFFILELTQYSSMQLDKVTTYNYIVQTKNNDFDQSSMTLATNKPPFLFITIFPMLEKGDHANLYIDDKNMQTIRNEKYLYVRFNGNQIALNSIKYYTEMHVGFSGAEDAPVEFMVLKDHGKSLFLLNLVAEEKTKNKISLMDMMNLK